MMVQCWVSHGTSILSSNNILSPRKIPRFQICGNPKKPCSFSCVLNEGYGLENITEIVRNKVLIAAGVSAAVGQLSKPFTYVLLYGKDFNFRTAFQAGGFPSTHSSSVVAAATSLALERGFSDSVFGLSLVYAGLLMYDAQGVRREVGNHAKVLNKLIPNAQRNARTRQRSLGGSPTSYISGKERSRLNRSEIINELKAMPSTVESGEEEGSSVLASMDNYDEMPLKESIGHTELEVVAGALLGFLVSLAVYTMI